MIYPETKLQFVHTINLNMQEVKKLRFQRDWSRAAFLSPCSSSWMEEDVLAEREKQVAGIVQLQQLRLGAAGGGNMEQSLFSLGSWHPMKRTLEGLKGLKIP